MSDTPLGPDWSNAPDGKWCPHASRRREYLLFSLWLSAVLAVVALGCVLAIPSVRAHLDDIVNRPAGTTTTTLSELAVGVSGVAPATGEATATTANTNYRTAPTTEPDVSQSLAVLVRDGFMPQRQAQLNDVNLEFSGQATLYDTPTCDKVGGAQIYHCVIYYYVGYPITGRGPLFSTSISAWCETGGTNCRWKSDGPETPVSVPEAAPTSAQGDGTTSTTSTTSTTATVDTNW